MPAYRLSFRDLICLLLLFAVALPFAFTEVQLVRLDNAAYDFQGAFNSTLASESQFADSRAAVDLPGQIVIDAPISFGNLNPFIDAVDQLRQNYPDVSQIDAQVRIIAAAQTQINFYRPPTLSSAAAFCNAAAHVILTGRQYSGFEVQYLQGPALVDLELSGPSASQELFIHNVLTRYDQDPSHPRVSLLFAASSAPFDVYFPLHQNPYIQIPRYLHRAFPPRRA